MKRSLLFFVALFFCLAGIFSQDLNQGLVAYYPFNGNANDESGNGNHGSPKNGVLITTDRFNKDNSAYYFDGINDYIRVPYSSVIEPTHFSISLWVKSLRKSTAKHGDKIITSDPYLYGNCTHGYGLAVTKTGNISFRIDGSKDCGGYGFGVTSLNSIVDNNWHHIVCIYDGKISLYVDGIFQGQTQNAPYPKTNYGIKIGDFPENDKNTCLGYIDDVRLYNRIISKEEIQILYNETDSVIYDINLNQYSKLQIGSQTWMGENLRTSRYNDGEIIPELSADHDWQNSNTGAYSWYNSDSVKYDTTYGKLYNRHAVNTGKLCPQGWHVPYAAEWQELYNFLGGDSLAGGTLKQMGFSDWNLPNTGATDSIGFTALPGGYRTANGAFSPQGSHGKWWSLSAKDTANAWNASLSYNSAMAGLEYSNVNNGYSVRCIKGDVATVETILAMDVTNRGAELCTHNKYFNIDNLESSGLMLLSADKQDTLVIVNPNFEEQFCVSLSDILKPLTTYSVHHFVIPKGSADYNFTGTPSTFSTGDGPQGSPAVTLNPPGIDEGTELSCKYAKVGGKMIDPGDDTVTVKGIYVGTQNNPRVTGDTLEIDSTYFGADGKEYFLTHINKLQPLTQYYVQAFARNSFGEGTGAVLDFITRNDCPNDTLVQNITLTSGWNIISSALVPADTNLLAVFQPLADAGLLSKVQDEKGMALEIIPGETEWTNNIGHWKSTEGYKVNVPSDAVLAITGIPMEPEMNIPLSAEDNIISYPFLSEQYAFNSLTDLILSNTLVKIQNDKGQALEKIPGTNSWFDNIGYFHPGRGYKVKMLEEDTLRLTRQSLKSSQMVVVDNSKDILEPEHYSTIWRGNGYDHMNLYLKNYREEGLVFSRGDEIAVYDGDICVGVTAITGNEGDYIPIIASADDPSTDEMDGFVKGRDITLKLWRNGVETEFETLEFFPEKASVFEPEGSVAIQLKGELTLNDAVCPALSSFKVYPNPFNNELVIDCNLNEDADLILEVRNTLGQLVYKHKQSYGPGSHKLIWDGSTGSGNQTKSGIYYVQLRSGDYTLNKTMKVIKAKK